MISFKNVKVIKILKENEDSTIVQVVDDKYNYSKAISYNKLTGKIKKDDIVVINTTATNLSLGTGGQDFVIYNHSVPEKKLDKSKGHIMKLRYTPNQVRCLAVEEEDSKYHKQIKKFSSLDDHIVVIATLHSMLAPIASFIRYNNPDAKINYIMTDDGALPITFSNNVRDLKELNIINNTITIGHAFGGDYESTNLYTGLITSKDILKSDVTIISMGPGIVGTGTKYGFSGINQAQQIDIVNKLGGKPIAVPRVSFNDSRNRHKGISHHTQTILGELTNSQSTVIFPSMKDEENMKYLNEQISNSNIINKHKVIYRDGKNIKDILNYYNLNIKTMGRGINEDPYFFETLGSVGSYVSEILKGK